MNNLPQKIQKAIPFEESIELLKKLVSINTVNPPGNEIKLLSVVKAAFEEIGAKMEIWEREKGRANFIGKIGSGKPILGFFPHLDTVPAGDGWKTDPFTPVVKNGKLYARGSDDSKGNFASSWASIKAFLTINKKFHGTIYLVGCADEETGSENGVKFLLEKGFLVDYAIVPDGGYIDKIIIGEKGILRIKIKSYGKQAHGSSPDRGINAIDKLIHAISKIHEITFDELSFHELFSPISKNVGVIKGGHAVNIVPAYAEAEVDFRFPLGIQKKDIIHKIENTIKEAEKEQKNTHFQVEEIFSTDPHITEKDTDLISAFLASSEELNIPMKIGTMGGVTDAKPLSFAGIQTLVHSMDDGSHTAHNANEYLLLKNLKTAATLYALTLTKIFNV